MLTSFVMCGNYVMEIFSRPWCYCTDVQPPPAKFMPNFTFLANVNNILQEKDKAQNIQECYKYFKFLSIFFMKRKCGKCAIFREKWAF